MSVIAPPSPAVDHRGDGRLHRAPRPGEVHVEHGRPVLLGDVARRGGSWPRRRWPRPRRGGRSGRGPRPRRRRGPPGRARRPPGPRSPGPACSTSRTGLGQVLLGGRLVPDVGQHRGAHVDGDHVGALGGEALGVGPALAPCRTGDEDDLAVEATHRGPPSRSTAFLLPAGAVPRANSVAP